MSGFIEVVDMSDGSVHYLVRNMIQADQIIRVECDDDESKITVYTKLFDDPLVSYWDSQDGGYMRAVERFRNALGITV